MKYHRLRSHLFNFLDKLPAAVGYYIYHTIQKIKYRDLESDFLANKNSTEIIIKILAKHDQDVHGKNILEIGSGWAPLMPYFFKYVGRCNNVYTYDINEHYDKKYICRVNELFKAKYNVDFQPCGNNKFSLPAFVIYRPKSNAVTSALPGKIDIVFSRFVLEHMTPNDILSMHQRFYEQFDKQTVFLHLVSPSDHRAYSDTSLSYYDFLKYSQREWDKIQTKFDYHNRLRLPQYLEIFKKAGFEIVHLEHDGMPGNDKKYLDFKKLTIHPDYLKYSEKEILAGSINVLLRKC